MAEQDRDRNFYRTKNYGVRVCVCVCVYLHDVPRADIVHMFYTCEVRTFNHERAHTRGPLLVLTSDSDSSSLKTQELTIKLWR